MANFTPNTVVTKEQEIGQTGMSRPHVVILGAGASKAACPHGDRNERPLPLMCDLVDLLELAPILDGTDIRYDGVNFEDVYSALYDRDEYCEVRARIEREVYNYFCSLKLPDTPTLYDHLILSLRNKDVIATFNWDPLLVQAYRRIGKRYGRPQLLFLHGNVTIGYCEQDKLMGNNGNTCGTCDNLLRPTQLLYPIAEKDYEKDGFITDQWRVLAEYMHNAYMITLFGYGAPESDVAAIKLLTNAWRHSGTRVMEQTEIINTAPEDQLRRRWRAFIHSHHYDITDNFYASWLANHPRRTGEAYINQYIDNQPIETNPIPLDYSFPKLRDWFDKLAEVEASP